MFAFSIRMIEQSVMAVTVAIYGVEKGFKFEFPLSSSSRFHVEVPRPSRNGSLCHPHCHIAGRANGMCRAGSRDLFWLIGKTLSRAAPWLSMLRFITFTGRVSKDIFLINVVIATAANVQIEFGHRMSALGQKQTFALQEVMSALPPCVDGSELARTFLNVCSIGRCSHVFGLFTRFT
jgi:hypothetical protein